MPAAVTEGPGSAIGPYRLIREIGVGGMGIVFLAEQERPIRRQVALKVIKPGMDTGQVIARFEAERQALALMNHPHIARVLDGGATATGRPYFVMELVQGIPITTYCDQERLTIRQRLSLFLPICRAIQHAHQKGIIHRDVKPSNVLIVANDGHPEPKVIDFGVAKAVDQRLTERTMFTEVGAVVGTLDYMSPEQADLRLDDIDTRSDLYSLGVLLYELLTGSTPLQKSKLRLVDQSEILRRIREEEPQRPSSRLRESPDALPQISARRCSAPSRLPRQVRGELDWIVMKALEKDRTRRYETAIGLARDVQRYLDGHAVEAGRPSTRYRLGKLARRHRAALLLATSFVGLLVAVAAASVEVALWTKQQLARSTRAEGEALANAAAAERAVALADEHKSKSEASERRALDQQARARERETIAIDAIRRYVDVVRNTPDLKFNPALGSLRRSLLQEPLDFFQRLRDRLDADSDTTPESRARLAAACFELGTLAAEVGDRDRSLQAYDQSREIRVELARVSPDNAQIQADLAASIHSIGFRQKNDCRMTESMNSFRQAVAIRARLVANHRGVTQFRSDLAASRYEVGDVHRQLGELAEAKVAYESAHELRTKLVAEHPTSIPFRRDLAASDNDLGVLLDALGDPAGATAAFDRARATCERLAAENSSTAQLQRDLAFAWHNAGVKRRQAMSLKQALEFYDKAREIRARLDGANPTVVQFRRELATTCNDRAIVLHLLGRLPEAMASFDEAVALRGQLAGADTSDASLQEELAASHFDIGVAQASLGANLAARASHERALDLLSPLVEAHPSIALFQRGVFVNCQKLGSLHQVEGRADLAQGFLDRADEAQRRLDAGNPATAALDDRLATVLDGREPRDGAERVALAAHAYSKRWYVASAQLYAAAFAADPHLLDDRWAQVAYDAACSAMLAGCGRERCRQTLDPAALARLRLLGLDWLKVELAGRTRQLDADSIEMRTVVRLSLQHWKQDVDLAGIRDEGELVHLPEAERAEYRRFWADVDRLLLRVAGER